MGFSIVADMVGLLALLSDLELSRSELCVRAAVRQPSRRCPPQDTLGEAVDKTQSSFHFCQSLGASLPVFVTGDGGNPSRRGGVDA